MYSIKITPNNDKDLKLFIKIAKRLGIRYFIISADELKSLNTGKRIKRTKVNQDKSGM
jgi:hypothetical protein